MKEGKITNDRDSRDREIEVTLIICSENPQIVASEIAASDSVGDYRLLSQDPKTIHDLYFDTPEHALQEQRLALRIREIGADRWITLKGPSQPTCWGTVERLEIEAPWSEESLKRVLKELVDRSIRVPQQRQDSDNAYSLDVMANLGLEVIQDRRVHREIKNIVYVGEEIGPILAEMAVDSVVYHSSGREVRHYEVEIEAKAEGASMVLKNVAEGLIAIYGQVLRGWDHSKLATGKAVEEMLNKGLLEGLLDTNSNLKPVAYDKIDDYLKRGSI